MIQPWRFILSHAKSVIAATLFLTIAFAAAIFHRGISFDGSPETLSRRDGALTFFNEIRASFGDDRVILVALTTEDVFTREFLSRLERLTNRLASIDGVSSALSLANVPGIKRQGDNIIIDRLIPRAASPADLQSLKETVTRDPLYERLYVSRDGKTTSVSVFLRTVDEERSQAITKEVERIARQEAGNDELLLAGIPVIDVRAINNMIRDIAIISPVAFLLTFLVFLFAFRSLWGAALAMVAMLVANIWTVGLMSLLGRPFTFATVTLPATLMAIGSSYVFHILNQYRISMSKTAATSSKSECFEAWAGGVKFICPAVIVSATTTMAGFGALASSRVPTARDMGAFEAAGVFFLLLLSMFFIPAALSLAPPRLLGRASEEKDYAVWLNGLLRQVTAVVLYRRRRVLAVSILITVLTGAGMYWIRVNTDYLRIFPEKSETVQQVLKFHERLAGAATINMVVSGEKGAAADPEFLAALLRFEEFALSQPGVDSALSIADVVRRFNAVLDPGAKTPFPSDKAKTEAIYDDYLSQDELVSRVLDRDRSRAIIVLRVHLYGSNELRALTQKLEEWSRANLPAGVAARATGSFILLNDASDALAASQSTSMAIAVTAIYLMMVTLFRSIATGLLALIPNLLPIICYYGFLGWMGITLDITTSLVASAVLGIAVDNAVHIIRRYRQSIEERGGDEGWVMWLSLLRTGKPILLGNLMLVGGNLLFMLSSFTPIRIAGLLWVITLLACLAADLIFLPALMKTGLFDRTARGESEARAQTVYAERG
ncbi:MAG: MMPL family transporter [Acidobacteriota bacterium]